MQGIENGLTIKNNKTDKKHLATSVLLGRILRDYVKPYTGILVISAVFMILSAAMTGGLAKLMEPIIDDVFSPGGEKRLWPVAFMVMGAFSLRGISTYAHTVLMNRVGQGVVADMQKQMFSKLVRMDISYFQKKTSGHLMTRVTSDTAVMRGAVTDSISGIAKSSLTLMILIAVMFYQDWKLTLISLFIFPTAAFIVAKIGKKLRRIATDMQEETGELASLLNQNFQGIRHIRAYGLETHEEERVGSTVTRLYKLFCKVIRVSSLATPMSEILSGLAIVTIIIYGGLQVIEGTTTAGKLFSFIAAFLMAYEPMKRLAKLNTVLQTGLAAAERIFEIVDLEPSIKDKPDAKALELEKAPNIEFKDVSFVYPNEKNEMQAALSNVSFKAKSGQIIAFVGPSGAGKTTIVNLVLRFYDPESGTVSIDGTDIRDVTMNSLRENMALVSQDITIFNDTVRDNIRAGHAGASDEEVMEAAKAATAHEFIMELENGYDTKLGEHGTKLSGGQRQRIAIARAMLRNAPLLLLDEATSALDNEAERAVQNALQTLQKGRTTLVIAHRLSTVQNADVIYVLENGEIVEQGKHATLLKKNGLYKRLYGEGLQ